MRILVLEDDHELAEQMRQALEKGGYVADLAFDGEEGEFLGSTENYAASVLDLGLPKRDGIEVLRRWRKAGLQFPVLILTARGEWADKVAGFRAGADDYLLKPFRMEEVLLRLSCLLRRSAGHATPELKAGSLVFDTHTGLATLEGFPIQLTAFESRLLRFFMLHAGRILSRTELSEQMYDHDSDRDFRSLEVVIGRLRRKIGPQRIETVHGEGYRLLPQDPV